jgi:hypothetical protein
MRPWLIIAFTVVFSVSYSFGWGVATHAYFCSKLGKKCRIQNYNEIYGALIRDTFLDDSLFFSDKQTGFLFGSYVWGFPGHENFIILWDNAKNRSEKSLAYGIAVNNNVWGMDITANSAGLTYGMSMGWSVQTAIDLIPVFATKGIWQKLQLDPTHPGHQEHCLRYAHWVVDFAGDILIAQHDKKLGKKILKSALYRSRKGVNLLIRVIGEEYEEYIRSCEKKWRRLMIVYGGILMMPEESIVDYVALLLTQRFTRWLIWREAPVPPELQSALQEAIATAMAHMKESFFTEIEADMEHFPPVLKQYGLTY